MKKQFLKTISLILIMAFLNMEMSWAYSFNVSSGQNLAAELINQKTFMLGESSDSYKDFLSNSKVLFSVFMTAEFLFKKKIPFKDLSNDIKELQKVIWGDVPLQIDFDNVAPLASLDEAMKRGLSYADEQIPAVMPEEGVIVVPYVQNKGTSEEKKYLIVVGEKDKMSNKELEGYKWLISDKYVINIIPVGEEIKAETKDEAEVKEEELQFEIEPEILEAANKAGLSGLPKTFIFKRIVSNLQKNISHAFKAIDAFYASIFTGIGSSTSFMGLLAVLKSSGNLSLVFVLTLITLYLGWATARYIYIGREVIKKSAALPQTPEKLKRKSIFDKKKKGLYFLSKEEIARSDGSYDEGVFNVLSRKIQDLIILHEGFDSHFLGMVFMMPFGFFLAKKNYNKAFERLDVYRKSFSRNIDDLFYAYRKTDDPSLKTAIESRLKGTEGTGKLLKVLKMTLSEDGLRNVKAAIIEKIFRVKSPRVIKKARSMIADALYCETVKGEDKVLVSQVLAIELCKKIDSYRDLQIIQEIVNENPPMVIKGQKKDHTSRVSFVSGNFDAGEEESQSEKEDEEKDFIFKNLEVIVKDPNKLDRIFYQKQFVAKWEAYQEYDLRPYKMEGDHKISYDVEGGKLSGTLLNKIATEVISTQEESQVLFQLFRECVYYLPKEVRIVRREKYGEGLTQVSPVTEVKTLNVPIYTKIIELSNDLSRLRWLVRERLEERTINASKYRNILTMSNEDILRLVNPKNIEVAKHSLAVWGYAQIFAKILGIKENTKLWQMLRVVCVSHDIGGILGYKRFERIEQTLLKLAKENGIEYLGKEVESVLEAFGRAGIRLSAQEKDFVKYMDHAQNTLRILKANELILTPKVERTILRHMNAVSEEEMDRWDEDERLLFICVALADIFENGNNFYKSRQKRRKYESVRETMHFLKNKKFPDNKYIQKALKAIEIEVLAGRLDNNIAFGRSPATLAENDELKKKVLDAEQYLEKWLTELGYKGTNKDLKVLIEVFLGEELSFLDRPAFKECALKSILEMLYRYDRRELIFEAEQITLFKKLASGLMQYYDGEYTEKILALLHFYWGITSSVMDNYQLDRNTFVNFIPDTGKKLLLGPKDISKEFDGRKTLIFEAHHDDAAFSLGNLIKEYFSGKKESTLVTVLSDPIGVDDAYAVKYANERGLSITGSLDEVKKKLREEEGREAASILGVEDYLSMGFELPVQKLRETRKGARLTYLSEFQEPPAKMQEKIEAVIKDKNPDSIILGIPRISYHPHHRDVSKTILKAIHKVNLERLECGTDPIKIYFYAHVEETYGQLRMHNVSPNIVSPYSPEDLERKRESLDVYESQFSRFPSYWTEFVTRDKNRARAAVEEYGLNGETLEYAEGLLKVRMEDYRYSLIQYLKTNDFSGAIGIFEKAIAFPEPYLRKVLTNLFCSMSVVPRGSPEEKNLVAVLKRFSSKRNIFMGSLYDEARAAIKFLDQKGQKRIEEIFEQVKKSVKVRKEEQWAVINAGGFGSRTWPMGDRAKPKQFLKISKDEKSLLQNTILRLIDESDPNSISKNNILVVTNKELYKEALKQLDEIGLGEENLIMEPFRLQDGPAIRLAMELIGYRTNSTATIRIITADHVIPERTKLNRVLKEAAYFSKLTPAYVEVGVTPTKMPDGSPSVNFQLGHLVPGNEALVEGVFTLRQQLEKDPFADYEQLISRDGAVWNAGYVVCGINLLKRMFQKYRPETEAIFRRYRKLYFKNGDFSFDVIRALYNELATVEPKGFNAVEAFAIPMTTSKDTDMGIVFVKGLESDNWWDVGNLDIIRNLMKVEEEKNYVVEGDQALVICDEKSSGNTIYSSDEGTRIFLHGVNDMVIALNPKNNSLLIVPRKDAAKAGEVPKLVIEEGVKQGIFTPHIRGENFPEEYALTDITYGNKGNMFVGNACLDVDSKDTCVATNKGAVALINVNNHTVIWDKDAREIHVYGNKKPELLNQFLTNRKRTKPHAFKAKSGYRAAILTGFLSLYLYAAGVFRYFVEGNLSSITIIFLLTGLYFSWAAIRYLFLARGVSKVLDEYYQNRYLATEGVPDQEQIKNIPIASNDGYRHPAFNKLDVSKQIFIDFHENLKVI